MERRLSTEVRLAGRRLEGVALHFGRRAADRAERFAPGSIAGGRHPLLLMHDPGAVVTPAAEVTATETELRVAAEVPPGFHALVQTGNLSGLSVGFRALEEADVAGVREVRRASLEEISLVTDPAYADSRVEARRGRRRVRGLFPEKRTLSCECTDHLCDRVEFQEGTIRRALDRVFAAGSKVAAFLRNYDHPLASVRKKTIRRTDAWGVELLLDAETFEPVRQATGVLGAGGLLLRPFLDAARSVFTRREGRADAAGAVAVYSDVTIRAFILSPADPANSGGWPPVEVSESASLDPAPAEDPRIAAPRRRRVWL